MAIFAIGDLHLSLGCSKPMDIFPGWEGYLPKLEANWRKLIAPAGHGRSGGGHQLGHESEGYPGGLRLSPEPARGKVDSERQPRLLVDHPRQDGPFSGRKRLCLAAHPAQQRLPGGRGGAVRYPRLPFDDTDAQDAKVMAREAGRLRMSLQAGGEAEKWAFLHYPPVYPRRLRPGAGGCAARLRRDPVLVWPPARQSHPVCGAGGNRTASSIGWFPPTESVSAHEDPHEDPVERKNARKICN